jgi:hypothetical protein
VHSHIVICLTALNPPLYSRGLRCCYMSHSFGSHLPTREGSGAAMCPTAPDPAFLLGRVPVLLCVTQLRTPPLCSGGLRCYHMSHTSRPRLPAREGFGAATWPPPPCSEGLRCCHVSHDSGSCFPAREGSPTLSRVPRLSKGREP